MSDPLLEPSAPSETNPRSKRTTQLAFIGSIVAISLVVAITIASTFNTDSDAKNAPALEYFKNVDEVLASPTEWQQRKIRLHGNVVAGTIQKKPNTLEYRFALYHGEKWLEVRYQGLVPDTFRDCAEVVVHGELNTNGNAFTATTLTAKCPSKYDESQRSKGCGEPHKPQVLAARGESPSK